MPSSLLSSSQCFRLDLSARAYLSERMDEPCTYEEFRACLHDLAVVNRVTLAYRPTRIWLEQLVAARPAADHNPLHIVDVGCGQGDMLRYIARWARRRSICVQLTGIDLNPYAGRAAAAIPSPDSAIAWVTGDAFSFRPDSAIDVVISSLFTHHLSDADIVRFLSWMESEARLGWFINDLHRGRVSYELFRPLAWVAQWHAFIRHDGPVSIRRSFREQDWRRYLTLAGLNSGQVSIEAFRPARLCVGRLRR